MREEVKCMTFLEFLDNYLPNGYRTGIWDMDHDGNVYTNILFKINFFKDKKVMAIINKDSKKDEYDIFIYDAELAKPILKLFEQFEYYKDEYIFKVITIKPFEVKE